MQVAKDQSFAYEAPKGFTKVDTLLERPAKEEAPSSPSRKKSAHRHPDSHSPCWTVRARPGRSAGASLPARSWSSTSGRPGAAPVSRNYRRSRSSSTHLPRTRKTSFWSPSVEDSEPRELTEVRKLVEKTLGREEDQSSRATRSDWSGWTPAARSAAAFDVEGFPTVVDPRRQGDRAVCPRRLQPRDPRDADHRDRHTSGREAAGQREARGNCEEARDRERGKMTPA